MNRLRKIMDTSFTINFGCFGFALFIISIFAVSIGISLLLINYL